MPRRRRPTGQGLFPTVLLHFHHCTCDLQGRRKVEQRRSSCRDVQVPRSTGRARAAIPGGQMSEGTTPGKEEVESRREQRPRAMHDSMDGGVRTASGTAVEEQLPRSAGAAFTRPFVAARSCCARKPGLAFLRSAFLLHSEVQSRPSVVCPFAGQIVHWTICKSPAHPWQARSPG